MYDWKDVGTGVMLWEPTAEARIEDTNRLSLQSSIGAVITEERQDGSSIPASPVTLLPSVEENLRTKQLIYEELLCTPDAPVPPNGCTPASSYIATASPPSIKGDAVSQLKSSITLSSSLPSEPDPQHLYSTPVSHCNTSDSSETVYDSDRTDFLEHPETPCPTQVSNVKSKKQTKRVTGRTSHYFPKTAVSKRELSVRRRLDFGTPKAQKTSAALRNSSKMVRAPEYGPNHAWTAEEDEVLCVLWRWYERQRKDYATIFNAYFGLQLKYSVVDNRFKNYVRFYGPMAFNVYQAVFMAVPFEDPRGEYEAIRLSIDHIISSLGLKLQRVLVEVPLRSGEARHAKSPKIRKRYKDLVKQARQKKRLGAVQQQPQERNHVPTPKLGRVAIRIEPDFDSSEYFTEGEDPSFSSLVSDDASSLFFSNPQAVPNLAFRVWDEGSRAKFDNDHGFVSEGFKLWKGSLPPPPQGGFVDLLLNNHMSMSSGGTSFWISVSTSLLQAFTKASNMSSPHIAIINLTHPTLAAPGTVLHAKQVLKRLKARGEAAWARGYQGWAEYLVFGRLERACIIKNLPLADLIHLFDRCSHVRSFLNLEVFTAGQRTMTISKQLQQRGTTLNASVGTAIAKLVLLMFGSNHIYGYHHIETFVCCVIESWVVLEHSPEDTASASYAFVSALGSHTHSKEELVGAFTRGIKKGIDTIKFFAKRRTKRRRTA